MLVIMRRRSWLPLPVTSSASSLDLDCVRCQQTARVPWRCARACGGRRTCGTCARPCWLGAAWLVVAVWIEAEKPWSYIPYCVLCLRHVDGMAFPGWPGGWAPSTSSSARTRSFLPRVPGMLYTVRRDLGGHGGLDVMADYLLLVCVLRRGSSVLATGPVSTTARARSSRCTSPAQGPCHNEASQIVSLSAAAGARNRLESDWMHGCAR